MDGLGDQVLAGAALALDQDGRSLAGRDLADEVHQLGHLGRGADHLMIAGAAPHLSAQRLDFGAQPRGLKRILDGDVELVEVQRLADEVIGDCPEPRSPCRRSGYFKRDGSYISWL